jgi:hypothetical protein
MFHPSASPDRYPSHAPGMFAFSGDDDVIDEVIKALNNSLTPRSYYYDCSQFEVLVVVVVIVVVLIS